MKKKHDNEQFDLNHPTAHEEATEIPIEHDAIFNRAEAVTERYALLAAAATLYPAYRGTSTHYADTVTAAAGLLDAVDAHLHSKSHAAAGDPDAGEQ